MKYTKYLLVLFSLMVLTASAQKLSVESFTPTTDAIARTRNVMGTDGNVCAAVVVRIPTAEATFDGGFILGRTPYKNGEYILDMQTGAAQMRVSVPGYNTIDVKFRDYIGSTLQSKTTYLLTINMPQAANVQKKQTLNIKVTPSDAVVLIDDEMIEGTSIELTVGSHKYNVAAKGYESQSGMVDVPENRAAKLVVELDRKVASSQAVTRTTTSVRTAQDQSVTDDINLARADYEAMQKMSAEDLELFKVEYKGASEGQSSQNLNTQTFTVKGVSFTMMPVEGGTFTMGATAEMKKAYAEEKPHEVELNYFCMGETEVTQELWDAVMGQNTSHQEWKSWDGIGSTYPAYGVSWNDCQEFITKLNQLTGKRFRLPTEAEWEYAARGGNKSRHTQYSGSSNIDKVAWYGKNSGSKTHPVKTKKANELGIYDMTGNVQEWCQDWYDDEQYSSSPQSNPVGPANGTYRVYRGGDYAGSTHFCRISNRSFGSPDKRIGYNGLRLALSE